MSEAMQAHKVEEQIRAELWERRLVLGGLLRRLWEHDNSRLTLSQWTQKVTAYEHKRGFMDFRDPKLSPERVEKSIEDARVWLSELESGKVVS